MTWPTFSARVAFDTNPTATPTWTDISSYVFKVSTNRGRQHELDRTEMGTATMALNNADQRFDPTYAGTLVNLLPNPSFETNLTSWSYTQNNTAVRSQTQATVGSWSVKLTNDGGGIYNTIGGSGSGEMIAVSPSTTYVAWASIFPETQNNRNGYVYIIEYTSAEGYITEYAVGSISTTQNIWNAITGTFTTSATCGKVLFRVVYEATALNDVNYVDKCQLEQASTATTYTDGSLDNCRWSGTAHASTSYRGGPHYGNILPMRRMQVYVTDPDSSSVYNVFGGYVEAWPPSWEQGVIPVVDMHCVDGFKVLSMAKLNTTYSQQRSGARLNAILDSVGWQSGTVWILDSADASQLGTNTYLAPNADKNIQNGNTTVQASTLADTVALTHVQDVALAEDGLPYAAADGTFTFLERHELYRRQVTSRATFGDAVSEYHYTDMDIEYDDSRIYNEVRMKASTGTVQTAQSTISQDKYFKRTLAEEDLIAVGDSEMADRANWKLNKYKDPAWRARLLSVEITSGEDYSDVLGLELGDRITVKRRPTPSGTIWEQDYIVQGIAHDIEPARKWSVSFKLAPAPLDAWILVTSTGDAYQPYSVLGETSVLGY